MRICLLTDQDLDAESLAEHDWPCDPRPFLPGEEWEVAVLEKSTAVGQVIRLANRGFDLFFNLCDGAWGEPRPGIEVVQALEALNVPFTGAGSEFYEPTRRAMKRACRAWGIHTPPYVLAQCEEEIERAADTLRFPLIVKHPSSYASIDLTRDSRVETADALFERAREMITKHAGALIEEFIDGRECTVLVAENPVDASRPTTYVPLEYEFPEGESFKHSDMKWVTYDRMRSRPVEDAELAARLREVSANFFRGLNGSGYGRCDLRVDAEGRPFMLEINANCGLYYRPTDAGSADLILLADPAGHEGFTRQIVAAAFERHRRRARSWEVREGRNGDHGVFVTRSIGPGERIIPFEEQPHELVTRRRVEREWDQGRLDWFRRYAWPLTDEVWCIWSRDPENWMPVNHACEPTAWLEGLDVVARRPLASDDEVTLDYATIYNELMPTFDCECGGPACRGRIRGEDYLADFVARYGCHVSPYVRRKRREAGLD